MRVARWTSLNPEEHGESKRGEEEKAAPERAPSCSQMTERPSKTVGSFSASFPGARILSSPFSVLFRQAGADINDAFTLTHLTLHPLSAPGRTWSPRPPPALAQRFKLGWKRLRVALVFLLFGDI